MRVIEKAGKIERLIFSIIYEKHGICEDGQHKKEMVSLIYKRRFCDQIVMIPPIC